MRGCSFIWLSCLLVSWSAAEIPMRVEGQLGGVSQAVAVLEAEATVCLGVGPRVVTLKVTDPNRVRELGRSAVFPEVIEDIVIRDGYAYVAAGDAGLYVLDVSDATAPQIIGSWRYPDERVVRLGRDLCLSGDYAYLADGQAGLQVIDVSNPAEPNGVAVFDGVFSTAVAVEGQYAYVGSAPEGVTVLDVSDPTRPVGVAQAEGMSDVTAIEVVDGHLYVTGGGDDWWGLAVFDAGDPGHLVCVGRCAVDYPEAVVISGKFAYVTNGWRGIDVIRITDPTRPARIGGHTTDGFARAIAVTQGWAYVAEDHGGLEVVDMHAPLTPIPLGRYGTIEAHDVAVSEPYAYVADTYAGMHVVDISDPAAPSLRGSVDLDYADCLALGKSHVYAGDGTSFTAIDVSDPNEPFTAAVCPLDCRINDIAVVERYAYVATDQTLAVVDVSDDESPIQVGVCSVAGHAWGVCVMGDYAYVTGVEGLEIFDVSDPAEPVRVGQTIDGAFAYRAAILSDCAYVAQGNLGLRVIDVSDPFLPGVIGGIDTAYARDVIASGHYALLLDSYDGLKIADAANPSSLTSVGQCITPGHSVALAVSGDRAYVAGTSGGLVVVKIDWPDETEPDDTVDP